LDEKGFPFSKMIRIVKAFKNETSSMGRVEIGMKMMFSDS
jgi:hypothetical protein